MDQPAVGLPDAIPSFTFASESFGPHGVAPAQGSMIPKWIRRLIVGRTCENPAGHGPGSVVGYATSLRRRPLPSQQLGKSTSPVTSSGYPVQLYGWLTSTEEPPQ